MRPPPNAIKKSSFFSSDRWAIAGWPFALGSAKAHCRTCPVRLRKQEVIALLADGGHENKTYWNNRHIFLNLFNRQSRCPK